MAVMLFACGGGEEKSRSEADTTTDQTETAEADSTEVTPRVFFIEPADGDSVSSPLKIQMGLEGMKIEPAGRVMEGRGHHHLVINGTFVEEGKVVPTSETSIHYGLGQRETEIELSPGTYTLTLQFADGVHQSYGEALSATIEVHVRE